MQKLWNLQLVMYRQLKHVKAIAEDDAMTDDDPRARISAEPYPIDGILNSCEAFIEILSRFESLSTADNAVIAARNTVPAALWNNNTINPSDILLNASASRGPVFELDTPTVCIVVSCHARLIDIYNELFQYLSASLQAVLERRSELPTNFPRFQLGGFRLRNCGSIQVMILVQIFLHCLRRIEKTMGVLEEHSVAGGGGGSSENRDSNEEVGGVFGQFGTGQMLDAISNGGGRPGCIESLRNNIKKVNSLLEESLSQ